MKHARKLTLEVVEARGLPAGDGSSPDPFVLLTVTPEKKKLLTEKSKAAKKTVTPQWNEKFEFTVEKSGDFTIQVCDASRTSAETLATTAVLSVSDFDGKAVDKWFPLVRKKGDKAGSGGELHLRVSAARPKEDAASSSSKKGADKKPDPAPPAAAAKPSDSKRGGELPKEVKGAAASKPREEVKDIFYYIRENDFNGLCDFLKNPAFGGINSVDSYGYTPLQSACVTKQADERLIMRLLQMPGIDVATPIKTDKNTALHYFCQNFKSPLEVDTLLQMFIRLGADPSAKNGNNETPLFKAVWNDSIRLLLVERLLEAGADVNIYNLSHGEGVLHYAVRFQRDDLMSMLLKAGAETRVKGKIEHRTPLELARHYNYRTLAEKLEAVEEMYTALEEVGLAKYKVHFVRKDFTKARLGEVKKATLREMGITSDEELKNVKKALRKFKKPKDSAAGDKPAPTLTQQQEDSSKSLQRIIQELDKLQLGKGEKKIGDWVIQHGELEFTKKLGAGAAGDVFSGLYRGKPVAIKVLKENMQEKELAEFKKEFQILCSVHSQYTVHFFGACLQPKLCMVMELCSRGSLCDVMKSKEPLLWALFFQLALETTLGIETLHDLSIVHRDLKSLNLLVTGDWHVKVCDFGLSRFDTQANDETLHQLRGTMAFCAPEVYHSSKFTPKSDIYSLIIVLWELAIRVVKGHYEAPYSEYKNLQYDFQIIIQVAKGMDGDPEKRPSLKEVIGSLQKWQKDFNASSETWLKAPPTTNGA